MKYSLKDYYYEYLKLDSKKNKLLKKQIKEQMNENKYFKELEKIENKFKVIEDYYLDISKDFDSKKLEKYMRLKR